MNKIFLDFETRSTLDIKKVGAWAYAQHPSTDIICMGESFGLGGQRWLCTRDQIIWNGKECDWSKSKDGERLHIAHNAHFEYAIYNLILHRRYGWPEMWAPKKWSCTMARAAMCGLPLELNELGLVLGVDTKKDMDGKKAMLRACKPIGIDPLTGQAIFDESPALYQRIYRYCGTDVETTMEIDAKLPEMPPGERKIWELDLTINRRGIRVDLDFARKAAGVADGLVNKLNDQLMVLTNGAVDKATQVASMKSYLKTQGVAPAALESLDKEGVTDLLADPLLSPRAREVLGIRRQVGKKNSIAKYGKAIDSVGPDGRVRGLLQYHAAHTGRWGGRGLQPQNFPKGFKPVEQAEAITNLMAGDFATIYKDRALDTLSDALRGLFIAAPGKTFICADFNAIEARVLFWLAGEEAALASYRRGESPYIDMARRIYENPAITKETHPQEYDIGKRTILGAGYGMGAEKFIATVYTQTAMTGRPIKLPLAVGELAISTYRDRYIKVKNLWYEIERAAMNAVRDPAQAYACTDKSRVVWGMSADRRFLGCRLPSGRHLRYYKPIIKPARTPWGEMKDTLHYEGYHPDTHQWGLVKTYGGALTENVDQAIARDLIVNGMMNVEAAGYTVLLTCHDEILAEVPIPLTAPIGVPWREIGLNRFIKLMCAVPTWAEGCPVKAEGWIRERYGK